MSEREDFSIICPGTGRIVRFLPGRSRFTCPICRRRIKADDAPSADAVTVPTHKPRRVARG